MRRPAIAMILTVLVAGTAMGVYLVRKRSKHGAQENTPIVHAEVRTVDTTVNATGTVRLRVGSEVRVGSQLSGIVKKLNVTVGSHVRAGELIAEIDDATVRARLAQAEAQAELDRVGLERATVDANRASKLLAAQLIPAQQAQDAQLAMNEAEARYQKSLKDRDLAKVDLGYVQIRAPISGTVASVSTQEGETVAASFTAPTFVTIIADDALELVAMVDETDIANVKPGDPASFTVDAYPARDFPGIVRSIAPKATIVSGVVNYEVTIHIGTDAKLLKPDMTANVTIRTAQHRAFMLPADAVQSDGDRSVVYILENSGPVRREVVTGSRNQGEIEIRKGITKEDKVLLTAAFSTPARGNQ